MKIFKYLFALAFTVLLTACPAPGHGRKPIKISALNQTVWASNQTTAGSYLALVFTGTYPSYFVGTATASDLNTALNQAETSKKEPTTYDDKKPGQIKLTVDGQPKLFVPLSQTEAEYIHLNHDGSSTGTKLILKRYK